MLFEFLGLPLHILHPLLDIADGALHIPFHILNIELDCESVDDFLPREEFLVKI